MAKIRTGFVSNSSSSSFVVRFDEKNITREQMQKHLFGEATELESYFGNAYPIEDVMDVIWQQFISSNEEDILTELSYKIDDDELINLAIDYYNMPFKPTFKDPWTAKEEYCRLAAKEQYEEFLTGGGDVAIFTLGNDVGPIESILEGEGIFSNLPNVFINGH